MFNLIARRLFLVLLGVFVLSGSNCGQDPTSSHPALGSPTAAYGTTGSANGGPGAPASTMNGDASVLANLIAGYRANAGLPTVSANNVLTGVAQAQADDMAASNAVALVGTDGEDVFQRLANSGYTDATVGVIAAGYNTDPTAVYDAMVTDYGANGTLLGNSAFNSIGVGYSNGYWMVILGTTAASTAANLQITTAGVPSWTVNQAGYSATITATGGTGAITFTAGVGSPPGLSLSGAGDLTGTPTVPGTYNFTVTASDSAGNTASQSYTLTINPAAGTVTILTTTLAVWDANLSGYNQTITATGGTGAITFTAGPGLPPGLSLSGAGALTGTPTTAGTNNFTVTATDSVGDTASQSYTLTINPAVSIVTTTVPNGAIGKAYSAPITTAGGTGAITLSVTSGSLPAGISLKSSVPSLTTFASGFAGTEGLAFDAAGNLYVANYNGNKITKVTPAGVTSTFVNGGGLNNPRGLAFDAAGNLYVANYGNSKILKVTPAGVTSTYLSGLNGPNGLAFDSAGNLYIANQTVPNNITKVTPAGVKSTFDTSGLDTPNALAFDTAGNLYAANWSNSTITKVTPAGVTSTFVSGGGLDRPVGLAFDTAGNLYVANWTGSTISKVTPAGVTSKYLSTGISTPAFLAFDTAGNLYVSNWGNSTVAKVTQNAGLSGTPTTAGTYNFTVTATDSLGSSATQSYSMTIP